MTISFTAAYVDSYVQEYVTMGSDAGFASSYSVDFVVCYLCDRDGRIDACDAVPSILYYWRLVTVTNCDNFEE